MALSKPACKAIQIFRQYRPSLSLWIENRGIKQHCSLYGITVNGHSIYQCPYALSEGGLYDYWMRDPTGHLHKWGHHANRPGRVPNRPPSEAGSKSWLRGPFVMADDPDVGC